MEFRVEIDARVRNIFGRSGSKVMVTVRFTESLNAMGGL